MAPGRNRADQYVQAVLLIKDQESNTREMMKAAKELQASAAKIHEELFLGEVEFSASEDASAKVEIAEVEQNASAAKKSQRKPGEFTFKISPLSPVRLSWGPALIYSFVELERFGTTQDGDEIKVVRTDDGSEVNGTTVAVMLGITPRAWDNPIFATSFELGVSPVEDEIGFFGGISIRAYKQFRFGVGRQARRKRPRAGSSRTPRSLSIGGRDFEAPEARRDRPAGPPPTTRTSVPVTMSLRRRRLSAGAGRGRLQLPGRLPRAVVADPVSLGNLFRPSGLV